MRIFILPTSYPDKTNPKKNIFIYEQAKELASRGHEVVVLHISKQPTSSFFSKLSNDIVKCDDGFSIRYCLIQKTLFEGYLTLYNKNTFINNAIRLYEYAIKDVGIPDVIYAHFSCWAGCAGAYISKRYGIPLVTIEHFGGFLSNNVRAGLKQGLNESINSSTYFLCVSEGLKKAVQKHSNTSKKIFVIPNMVDRSFAYIPPLKKEKFVISSIANLNRGKGFDILIQAFSIAFSKDDNVVLRIGGDGKERNNIEKLIRSVGREHQIKLLGRLNRNQTIDEYKNCDCFALASNFETYGIVYREALVTGRPIITTDHGGFTNEDWDDSFGKKVPIKDIEAFAESLREVYENISLYDGKKISEKCLNSCSPDMIGRLIEEKLLLSCNTFQK